MADADADALITKSIQTIARLYAYVQRLAYSELMIPRAGSEMKRPDAIPFPLNDIPTFTVKSVAWPGLRMKATGTGKDEFTVLEAPRVYVTRFSIQLGMASLSRRVFHAA
jgi:hypothetical protein